MYPLTVVGTGGGYEVFPLLVGRFSWRCRASVSACHGCVSNATLVPVGTVRADGLGFLG